MTQHPDRIGFIRSQRQHFGRLPFKLIFDRSVSDGARVTWLALTFWDRGRDNATCLEDVAEARGVNLHALQGHLTELERSGWITRHVARQDGWLRREIQLEPNNVLSLPVLPDKAEG